MKPEQLRLLLYHEFRPHSRFLALCVESVSLIEPDITVNSTGRHPCERL